MNIFTWIGSLFKKAFNIAVERGLTDELLNDAKKMVIVAAGRFADNSEKREWVVKLLVLRGLPESVARFAVEAAVQLIKKESSSGGS